jgi:hypothetical protein
MASNGPLHGFRFRGTTTAEGRLHVPSLLRSSIAAKLAKIPTTTTLRKFPPEVRNAIWKLCLGVKDIESMVKHGEVVANVTPELLVALRADSRLYNEVLEVFYDIVTFELKVESFEHQRHLSVKILSLIKHITLGREQVTDPYNMWHAF